MTIKFDGDIYETTQGVFFRWNADNKWYRTYGGAWASRVEIAAPSMARIVQWKREGAHNRAYAAEIYVEFMGFPAKE